MAGERIVAERYRLDEPIGAGGMGEVWRATDLELRRVVAMKRSHDAGGAGQLRREGRIGAGLQHPNVVTVYDTVHDGTTKWLVMEYLPARSLSDLVRTDGPLAPEEAAAIGAQIAAALAAMHDRGMVHRDVTPANVLVTPERVAKLTDFGISSWDELTLTGDEHVAGTPAYLAPEAAAGHEVRFPADVFALGAVLFAAVEGHSPWGPRDLTPGALRQRAVAGELTPSTRAGALAPVLTELMRPNPAARPTAGEARQLLEAIGGTTVPTSPLAVPSEKTEPRQRVRRTRILIGAGVGVVALVAAATVVGNSLGQDDQPVAGAGAVLDIHTADPCAIVDRSSLSGFGTHVVQLDSEQGKFNQCGLVVLLPPADDDLGHVALYLEPIPEDVAPSHPLGQLGPIETPAERDDGHCDRIIPLPDGNQARVDAYNQGARAAEPCAMADAVARAALTRLRQGPIPRRKTPFPAASLANTNACTLLPPADVGVVFGGQAPKPEPEPGNWTCYWDGDGQEVTIEFTREWQEQPSEDDEVLALDPWVGTVDTRDQACAVEIHGREYTKPTDTHDFWMEQTTIILDSDDPGVDPESLCGGVKLLAAAVAKRLPT